MNLNTFGTRKIAAFILVFSNLLMISCARQPSTLKEAFADDFLIGAAVNGWIYSERDTAHPALKDIEASIIAFGELGIQVHVTELDINVLPTHPQVLWRQRGYLGRNGRRTEPVS